jgi:hypothetical protein
MRNCSFLILLLVGISSNGVAQQAPGTSVVQPAQLLPPARAAIPQQTMFLFNPADKIMNIAALVLEARLATNANSAIPIWRRAVEAQDALSYDDPPAWYYWIRQSLAAELLRSGRAVEAETVFRQGLCRSPRNRRLLFGLWKCLEAQGRSSDAGWVQREFAASWRGGDPASSLHIEDF